MRGFLSWFCQSGLRLPSGHNHCMLNIFPESMRRRKNYRLLRKFCPLQHRQLRVRCYEWNHKSQYRTYNLSGTDTSFGQNFLRVIIQQSVYEFVVHLLCLSMRIFFLHRILLKHIVIPISYTPRTILHFSSSFFYCQRTKSPLADSRAERGCVSNIFLTRECASSRSVFTLQEQLSHVNTTRSFL